jgi:hypothetical protein
VHQHQHLQLQVKLSLREHVRPSLFVCQTACLQKRKKELPMCYDFSHKSPLQHPVFVRQLSFLLDVLKVMAQLWFTTCFSLSVGSYLCSCNRGYEAVPLDGLNSTLVSNAFKSSPVCMWIMLQTKRWLVRGSNVISAPWERHVCLLREVLSFITLQTKRAISDDLVVVQIHWKLLSSRLTLYCPVICRKSCQIGWSHAETSMNGIYKLPCV